LHPIGWERITLASAVALSVWWMDSRRQVPKDLRKGFDSLVLLMSWCLWKQRNSCVFDNAASSASLERRMVLEVGNEWITVGFTAISSFLVAVAMHP
jgi:hypothetical protein